jgi:nucleotidyltransferase/DNA polymerase involved in DNA repair
MKSIILHVDMDAFFASIEQRDNPFCRGKPVIVGSDPKEGKGRGVVAACSYEARRYGIHSAMPISQAYHRCPNATFLRPRMRRYQEVSRSIREIFYYFTPLVEPISIDEAFLDITGSLRLFGTPEQIANSLKKEIREKENLCASVGIAPNKFLAKMASAHCKPDGLLIIKEKEVKNFLHPLPISKLWGVGKKTEQKLAGLGIETIGQLAALKKEYLESLFGKAGIHLWYLSQGIDNREIEPIHEAKSISHEITFEEDIDDVEIIKKLLLSLAQNVARRARQNNMRGYTVTLKLRYSDFHTINRSQSKSEPLDTAEEIFCNVKDIIEKINLSGKKIRLIGISLSNLISAEFEQISMFREGKEKKKKISQAEDKIINRFGDDSITRALLIKPRKKDQ